MLFDDFVCNVKILTVLKLSWDHCDADAAPRNFHAISFRTKGSACCTCAANQVELNSGDIMFVPENIGYHIKANNEELYVIHFESKEKVAHKLEKFQFDDYIKIQRLFSSCYDAWIKKDAGYYFKVLSIFYNILEIMLSSTLSLQIDKSYLEIKPAIDYLHIHFCDTDISVKKLCNIVHMSDTWFRKLFFLHYHTTPIKYINQLRISYAKELIESGFYKIEQISGMTGFEDSKYFSTVFKHHTGCSPSIYKKLQ